MERANKPNSVTLRGQGFGGRRSFIWATCRQVARAPYPQLIARRAVSGCLFGLAGGGVYPAGTVTRAAVRSYRAFSPLPATPGRDPVPRAVCFLWHFPSARAGLPLATTVPCPVRTFLPAGPPAKTRRPSDRLACSISFNYITFGLLAVTAEAHHGLCRRLGFSIPLVPAESHHWRFRWI